MAIEHRTVNELVYEQLRSEILEGKLSTGAWMKQEELTEKLGVSRTPVREALKRLEAEGLVQFVRRTSAVVSTISQKRVHEIFDLRALLEGYAAEKAVDNLTEKDIQKLRKLITEMDENHSRKKVERLLARNDEFHHLICERAGNETLLEMLEPIWRDIKRLRINYLITPEGHERSTREHEQLVDALERRDKQLVLRIVQEHIASSKEGILSTTKPFE